MLGADSGVGQRWNARRRYAWYAGFADWSDQRGERHALWPSKYEQGEAVSPDDSARSPGRLSRFARSMRSIAARAGLPLAGRRIWWLGALIMGFWLGCVAATVTAAVILNVNTTSGGVLQSGSPWVRILSPRPRGLYGLLSGGKARFSCGERVTIGPIVTCTGAVANGHAIDTRTPGLKTFTVTAVDTAGDTMTKSVHYTVLGYTNPLRAVRRLHRRRIDQGVDYAGSGPILALGSGRVTKATDRDPGWLDGGVVVYRLSRGPLAGKVRLRV
jgi:hypothetical protein